MVDLRNRLVFSVLWLSLSLQAACAHVPPYDRGNLARSGMDTSNEQSEDRFRSHVRDAREASGSGQGSAGGGCGCN